MSSAIEQTVKALVDFESELGRAKAEASDAKRKAAKDALDWADSAKSSAIQKAHEIASARVSAAKEDAEAQADAIMKKGESDLKSFEGSISKNRSKAAELVSARLLGESS